MCRYNMNKYILWFSTFVCYYIRVESHGQYLVCLCNSHLLDLACFSSVAGTVLQKSLFCYSVFSKGAIFLSLLGNFCNHLHTKSFQQQQKEKESEPVHLTKTPTPSRKRFLWIYVTLLKKSGKNSQLTGIYNKKNQSS